jgi:hypothetical protein
MIYINEPTEMKLKFEKFFRFDTFLQSNGWEELTDYFIPNSNVLNGLTAFNNFDPFITERYENLSKIIIPKVTAGDSEFNRFWAIGDVINTIQPPNMESIKKMDDEFRIRWFSCAISSQGLPQSAELLNNIIMDGNLEKKVIVEEASADSILCPDNNEKIGIIDYRSNPVSIKLNVVAPSDGWLLQLSTNYPGWKVKIDGNEGKVYYGDILFRAIKLTKGNHAVEFYYQPLSFILGLSISIGCTCILLVYILLKRRRMNGYNAE